jgi:tRNA threonylcarbamoyladenosine biosynthesis protein TsaB
VRLLAFDTSTDTLSMAVSRTVNGEKRVWQSSGPGGSQASSSLIGGVMQLLRQADMALTELDAICFGSGPGSFTGLRTACSVAQGLAFGAGVPVLPVPSLLAVAQTARMDEAPYPHHGQVTALLDARMDEIYAATYSFEAARWTPLQAPCLVTPEELAYWALAPQGGGWYAWAGNIFGVYAGRLQHPEGLTCVDALPTAAAMLQLAPALLAAGQAVPASQALPLYVRDKVAKTTVERAAEKAEKEQLLAPNASSGAHA